MSSSASPAFSPFVLFCQRYGALRDLHSFPPRRSSALFAGIISNPPYIPAEVAANLQPEVGRHEPMSALDGRGEMGMGDLDVICELSHKYLAPGGFLALETHGGEQALRVWEKLWNTNLYEDVRVRSDYAGVDRFVTARLIDTKKVDTFSSNSSSNNNSSDD